MKTRMLISVLAAAFALAAAPVSSGQAQEAPVTAQRLAAEVQAFYDQTRTVRTAFSQSHYDRVYRRTTRSRGVLTVARPGKLRFDYLGGDGKVVVSDGSMLTIYEPGDEGDPGQYARTAVREDLSSALGFLTGQARLDRDFRFRLRAASDFGWSGHVLELRPLREEPGYARMFLFVDANQAGVVRRVIVQDHAGNLNRFDFQRTQFNSAVPAERFAFTPPRGARRI